MSNKNCKWCGRVYEKPFLCSDHRDRGYCSVKCEHEAKEAGKDGCFLTTACVNYAGYEDDCYQLLMLRDFRDNYLKNQSNGKELISEYYEVAPSIVTMIYKSSQKKLIFSYILKQVNDAVLAIEESKNDEAFRIYSQMFNSLRILAKSAPS